MTLRLFIWRYGGLVAAAGIGYGVYAYPDNPYVIGAAIVGLWFWMMRQLERERDRDEDS